MYPQPLWLAWHLCVSLWRNKTRKLPQLLVSSPLFNESKSRDPIILLLLPSSPRLSQSYVSPTSSSAATQSSATSGMPAACSTRCHNGTSSPGAPPSPSTRSTGREEDMNYLFAAALRRVSEEPPLQRVLALQCTVQGVSFGEQVQGVATELGLDENVYIRSVLINLYSKAGCIDAAMLVIDKLLVRKPVTDLGDNMVL